MIDTLESVDILCAPVNGIASALADPRVMHDDMMIPMQDPECGPIKVVGIPGTQSPLSCWELRGSESG